MEWCSSLRSVQELLKKLTFNIYKKGNTSSSLSKLRWSVKTRDERIVHTCTDRSVLLNVCRWDSLVLIAFKLWTLSWNSLHLEIVHSLLSGVEKPSSNLERVQSVCRAVRINLQPSFKINNVGDSLDLALCLVTERPHYALTEWCWWRQQVKEELIHLSVLWEVELARRQWSNINVGVCVALNH